MSGKTPTRTREQRLYDEVALAADEWSSVVHRLNGAVDRLERAMEGLGYLPPPEPKLAIVEGGGGAVSARTREIAGAKKALRLAWPHRHRSLRARIVIASKVRFLRTVQR
jgi:hypothetical protein